MKRLFIITFLMLAGLFSQSLEAQRFKGYYQDRATRQTYVQPISFELGAQTTRSIRGWYSGWSMAVTFKNKFGLTYYNTSSAGTSETGKRTDQGIDISYSFNSRSKLSFGPEIRLSVIDKRFVSAIPSMQSRLALSEIIIVKGGVGWSDRYPLFNMGLSVRLN
ncbi:hypothetical protein [Roseivirga sp.]|uniref:hypothetical protein n=1 Tax=Roseivirga sp. TaxID=1964215 RepID=UPI003B51A48F